MYDAIQLARFGSNFDIIQRPGHCNAFVRILNLAAGIPVEDMPRPSEGGFMEKDTRPMENMTKDVSPIPEELLKNQHGCRP